MKKLLCFLLVALFVDVTMQAQTADLADRALWASICTNSNVTTSGSFYSSDIGKKVLVSWRMLPTDNENTAFDLYRRVGTGSEIPVNGKISFTGGLHYELTPIAGTNYVDSKLPDFSQDVTYRLTYSGSDETLCEYVIKKGQLSSGLPYITIPLKDTKDVYEGDDLEYQANDVSVGDLDGDGQFEIIVKRLQSPAGHADGGIGASYSSKNTIYAVIWDAYKLDGTFLWRIKGGPGIILGNSSAFAVADFDGDGCAEMIIRTCEGTVFGDGQEIPDTNGDGKIDYRTWGNLNTDKPGYVDHYNSAGPEFISVIDGKTGKELARDNFIDRHTSDFWGDGYWKRACSFRVGVAYLDGAEGLPSLILGRGVYARSILEAWDYKDGKLTKRWQFDSGAAGGTTTNKDGKANSAYGGQGNHSFTVADLDGDGFDEVMYGSMAMDHDGYGLWSTGLGHGDAQHVGKFLPNRKGLQMYHCLESGTTMVALHDAKDGSVIWKQEASSNNDTGRAMVADIDPNSPGCEFWWAGSNAYSQNKNDFGYKPASCNMAIWFDGTLSRQLINENIIQSQAHGRTFTMYRYSEHFINGTKSNPSWYGDLVGDWREEVIVPDQTLVGDLKIFSTWYPTEHRFPWLMTDHTYHMGVLNENIGYNQPPNLGYYLGTDIENDQQAWAEYNEMNKAYVEAFKEKTGAVSVIEVNAQAPREADNFYYTISGQRMTTPPAQGIYIYKGKKYLQK